MVACITQGYRVHLSLQIFVYILDSNHQFHFCNLVSSERSLFSFLYPGAKKAYSLILVILFSQEKLQAALKKLRKEQSKMEELEADIREDKASWKAGRDIS